MNPSKFIAYLINFTCEISGGLGNQLIACCAKALRYRFDRATEDYPLSFPFVVISGTAI